MTRLRSHGRGALPALELGEGPVWDAAAAELHWLDVTAGRLLTSRQAIGGRWTSARATSLGPMTVTALLLARDGSMLMACGDRLALRRPDGSVVDGVGLASGSSRTNDATVDPGGRALVGTLSEVGSAHERLIRLEPDGRLTVLDDDLTLSNGLGFAPDGSALYSVDSVPGVVWVREYDAGGEHVGRRRPFVDLRGRTPDGLCVDQDGGVWVAIWGEGTVLRYDAGGELTSSLCLPVPQPAGIAFAGRDLRTLVVTTAREDLDEPSLARARWSGRTFRIRVDVPGVPVAWWDPAAALNWR